MKENNNMKCDPCEQDFKKKVRDLVKEGKAPTHNERVKKEHEVKGAFGHGTSHSADHTAGHSMTGQRMGGKMDMHDKHKEPVMGGMHKKK